MGLRQTRSGAAADHGVPRLRVHGYRTVFWRLHFAGALLVLLLASVSAHAHDPIVGEFTCPLCQKRFTDVYLWHQPLRLNELEPGIEPGLYVRPYVGPGEYIFLCCPHCGYSNEVAGFHVVGMAEAEVRENPYAPPPPAAKDEANGEGTDKADDGSEQEPDRRFYAKLFAAQPLDFPAIKAAVDREVDPSVFRYVNAYFPERLDILLRTVPDLSALERYHVALTGMAACDRCAETERGLDFRMRAIEAGREILADGLPEDMPEDMRDDGRLALRYLTAKMMLTVGRARRDDALRAEGRRAMKAVCEDQGPPDNWSREGRKHLAADALAGLSVEKALAAVRDASPVEREAFLMLHGWRWREPPVRGFVRDLLLPQWQTDNDVRLLKALAANPKTHGHYRKLAANLAPRPVTLGVKYELMEHAADIPVAEVTEALRRWTTSGDPELARDARDALERTEQHP